MDMIYTKTPLRFSLLGGGTDLPVFWQNYQDSEFISLTLQLYIHTSRIGSVFDSLLFDKQSINNFSYSDVPNEIIRNILLMRAIDDDLYIDGHLNINSDVKGNGSGLGTSSGLIVSVLQNLNPDWSEDELCREANFIEIDLLRNPIGWQDAMASAWGGLRYYRITKDGSYSTSLLCDDIGYDLCNHIIAFQLPNSKSPNNETITKSPTHKQMIEQIDQRLDSFIETLKLIDPMIKALVIHDFKEVGNMLYDAWLLKQETHNNHNVLLNAITTAGMESGAWGVKVTGSLNNNTGCVFFICPDERAVFDAIRYRLKSLPEIPIYFEPNGSRTWCIG